MNRLSYQITLHWLLALVLCLGSCMPGKKSRQEAEKYHVLYGEHNTRLDKPGKGLHRLFFDQEGRLYPDHFIPDSSLKTAKGSLKTWYKQHPEQFRKIAGKYHLEITEPSDESMGMLQDAIIHRFVSAINAEAPGYDAVSFLVHGFRKPFAPLNGDYTSYREFGIMRKSLSEMCKSRQLFIEVYWDGMYDCCFSAKSLNKNKAILNLFSDYAQPNAMKAGYALRRVAGQLKADNINLLSHSLGARLVVACMFNTDSLCSDPAPQQRNIRICLIAPAIPGKLFDSYYNRGCEVNKSKADNYKLQVVYNEKDFVLLKKDPRFFAFGPGPNKYGVTTLGCNYKGEIKQMQKLFSDKYPSSTLEMVDFSAMGTCHHMRCYCTYKDFSKVAAFLDRKP